jgi:predicted lipoprotein with Yx(FWY)xxD motif
MKYSLLCIGILCAAILVAGCSEQPVTPPVTTPPTIVPDSVPSTVIYDNDPVRGTSLVDSSGMTLYYYARDIPGSGKSACNSTCQASWTPFYTESIVVRPPLSPAAFGNITFGNGTRQTTYRGWPLYYFRADSKPFDTHGDGTDGLWYVMKPFYSIVVMHNDTVGTYLADGNGMTLYTSERDPPRGSVCSGNCLVQWQIILPQVGISTPSYLEPASFARMKRTDQQMQAVYKEKALYYFWDDVKPGEIRGQGVDGVWSVAAAGDPAPRKTSRVSP